MRLYITRLKTIFQFKYLLYVFLFIVFIYCFVCIKFSIFYTKYNKSTKGINGIIKRIDYKEDKCVLYIDDVIVNYKGNLKGINIGDYVYIPGILKIPGVNTNFNLFNYRNYLYSNKIHYVMDSNKVILVKHCKNIFYYLKKKILSRIDNINNNYLYAFILGDTSYIDSDIKDSFSINGISHLFSISGMHVSLLVIILSSLLSKFFSNKNYVSLFIIIFLLFYAFLANLTPSIVRATFVFIFCYINKKYKLNIKTKNILLFILCICLIYNPFYIFNTGFLFSYIISYSLISYSNMINKYKNYFVKIFITSLISFLFSIPILINNYFNINLLSPFINIIFVPLISLIIFPLSLLILFIPKLSFIYNFFIFILEFLSKIISHINYFNISLCHMNIVSLFLYYLIIIIIISNFKYIYFLIIVFIFHHNISYFESSFRINFLDVGQGDSILISFPYNKSNILIDSPFSNNKNISKDIIIPYLKSIGINKIDYLIITHGDSDHIGGSIDLINNFKVEKVIFNCGEYNDLEQELIKVLDKKRILYYSCIKELNINRNKLYFLQTKEYDNENDNSNVIYTELGGYKFMFMGDAEASKEKDILDKYNIFDIDVLKVGHHGSKTSSSKIFINEIKPKYSIISVGKNNRYGHPNIEVLNNLNDSKIYRTDKHGSVIFKIKNNKLKIETCNL